MINAAAVNTSQKVLFIANKRSGTGSYQRLEAVIQRAAFRNAATCAIKYTQSARHATELAREGLQEKYTAVVAVGGDGTVNEVACGLIGSHVPLGIIPGGSGNGLARHLGIPLDKARAVEAVFSSEPIKIDTFTINGRVSVNVSGIGFDGHVANLFGRDSKRGLGEYARIALREYTRFREFESTLTLAGTELRHRSAFIIAIANSSQYGNNARVVPHGSVCDGKINVNVIRKIPLSRLDAAYALFKGDITRSGWCEVIETDALAMSLNRPVEYHIDGEPCGASDAFSIRINPSSLTVLVPPAMHGQI